MYRLLEIISSLLDVNFPSSLSFFLNFKSLEIAL